MALRLNLQTAIHILAVKTLTVTAAKSVFEVKSTNGDTHLGGEDLPPLESTVMVAMVYNI